MTFQFSPNLGDRLRSHTISLRKRDERYSGSYEIMLAHFEDLWLSSDPTPMKAHAGVLLVYTWMGRPSPDLGRLKNYDAAVPALRAAKAGERLSVEQLESVREYVSGSMIGASKYLHFLRPDIYPIWDQWVAQAVSGEKGRAFLQSPANYKSYMDQLHGMILPQRLDDEIVKAIGQVSRIRKAEFAIFNLATASAGEPALSNGDRVQ